MVIAKDEKGTLHIMVGPEEIAENLPAMVAEALLNGCCFDVDERVDSVNELILKGRNDNDQRRELHGNLAADSRT